MHRIPIFFFGSSKDEKYHCPIMKSSLCHFPPPSPESSINVSLGNLNHKIQNIRYGKMKSKSRLTPLPIRPAARSATSQATIDKVVIPQNHSNPHLEDRVRELEAKLSVALQRIDELELHTSLKHKHFDISDYEIVILN
jgi:hypothetical protein